jgi:oligopeptide transport system substrate-binding protein
MAVDRGAIVRQATSLNEPILGTLVPRGSIPGYESPRGLGHDPEEARRLLAEAGWSDRNGDGLVEDGRGQAFPAVDLLWPANQPRYKWISLALKAQWERELGVRIELRSADSKLAREDLRQGRFMIASGRWYGDYGDPTTFLDLCRSTDGNNDRGYVSAAYDRMLDEAAAETDPAERLRRLSECERFLMEDEAPMLTICQLVEVYLYEPGRLLGLSHHPRLAQYLWKMSAERP